MFNHNVPQPYSSPDAEAPFAIPELVSLANGLRMNHAWFFGGEDAGSLPVRFAIDRALDGLGDAPSVCLTDYLIGLGVDPRARDGQQGWSVRGRRGGVDRLVLRGWTELAARSLVAAVRIDGVRVTPPLADWRAVPDGDPDEEPGFVMFWQNRDAYRREDGGRNGGGR